MRSSASLGDTSSGAAYSPTSVLNTQFSAVEQLFRILQVENSALKQSARTLRTKNDYLAAENDTLRAQNKALLCKATQLEQDNNRLTDNLRSERSRAALRLRKILEDRNKLQDALRQRDLFIRAMIDIKLHQPVLKNAYDSVERGHSADDAIIEAIRTAADQLGSPWCKITAQPDITKSDLYLSAIEFATNARIRLEEHTKLTRFWKHMAKSVPQTTGLLTPSPSTLLAIDKELEQQEQSITLDNLLKRLRAGESVDAMKGRRPILIRPDSPDSIPPSPTLAYLQFHRAAIRRHDCKNYDAVCPINNISNGQALQETTPSPSSCASSLFSTQTDTQCALGVLDFQASQPTDPNTPDPLNRFVFPYIPVTSLERICAAFSTPDSEDALEEPFFSEDSLQAPATGRGRSATVPFSARDLILLPVKTVTSKQAILTPRGDKERKAQAMSAHRAHLGEGASLIRSKAMMFKKSSGPLKSGVHLPRVRSPGPGNSRPVVSTPPSSYITDPSKSTKSFPTPPSGNNFIRPPTVTRDGMLDNPWTEIASKGPSCKMETTISHSLPIPSISASETDSRVSTISLEHLVKELKQKINTPPNLVRTAEYEKENIPPQPSPATNRRSGRSSHQTVPRFLDSTTQKRNSARLNRSPSSVGRPIATPTQPLKFTKKNLINKPALAPTASITRLMTPLPLYPAPLRPFNAFATGNSPLWRPNQHTQHRDRL